MPGSLVSDPALLIAGVSLILSILAISISYLQYKAPTHSERFEREQMMRERFERIPRERQLPDDLVLQLSEPRVRKKGFQDWVWSIVPGGKPPWYTHFGARVYYPEERYNGIHPNPNDPDHEGIDPGYPEPPSPEDLEGNEKLRKLGVCGVEYEQGPRTNREGSVVYNPTSDFRVYVDSVEPDAVGNVMESFRGVVEEIMTEEEVIVLKDEI